ncbi:MAG TPA: ribosome silencing factor [Blastocatellia bacterium]|nr:ribosome silencing factor [Blastocatellia bacterium]
MAGSPNKDTQAGTLQAEDALAIIVSAAEDKKATDIVVLDLRKVASFTEYFIICTGANQRQVQAIADSVEDQLRRSGKRPMHIEGYSSAEWILLDYGDFIVHILSNTSRRFYDLERLWRDADRVTIKQDS